MFHPQGASPFVFTFLKETDDAAEASEACGQGVLSPCVVPNLLYQ